ncbi:MAG: hypothetical protein K8W52_17100 [Deltaproteobacteria bacterium]|nr:hypothetical protein [Deltaproteobacteria bacterium]
MRLALALFIVMAGAASSHAETLHLDQLNLDVGVSGDASWKASSSASEDQIDSDLFIVTFHHLGTEMACPALPATMGSPTTDSCPVGFTCVANDGPPRTLAGTTVIPGFGCLGFGGALVDVDSVAALAALVADVRAKIAAQHIADVSIRFGDLEAKLAIRDPRAWHTVPLPADDRDAPSAILLAYDGAPPRTGIAATPGAPGSMCVPSAPGAPLPSPVWRQSTTVLGVTKACTSRWNFVILGAPGEDDDATRRWAVPALIAYAGAEIVDHRRAPGERPFWGLGKLYVAGARVSPEIDDAGAFGAGRVGLELVAPLTEGAIAPAVSFGTSLGLDGSFHLAADIYLGFGLGTEVAGCGLFATAVAGADRDGPDSSSTFGGRGYLGVAAAVHAPLGIASLDGGLMWNTVEKRLSAGVSPRGTPLGAGLLIHVYDQSTAVMLYVGITGEGMR